MSPSHEEKSGHREALKKLRTARRVQGLASTGVPIVAMCPICFGNLKRSGARVEDLSAVMARSAEI